MNRKDFDWDDYLAQASYREVVDLSPALSIDKPPTMYSPDHSLLYLSSQDLDVLTDDVSQLQQLLKLVLETYRYSQEPGFEKKRLAAITDCYEICGLLVQCGVDSDEYLNPDLLLNSKDL
ncbi:MAG: hypothetical protein ACKOAU_00460 [Pirellula sp.]|jgi:hypothetical protein